jgi:hypothetical protein
MDFFCLIYKFGFLVILLVIVSSTSYVFKYALSRDSFIC